VEIIPELRTTCTTVFKVIRSNIKSAITPPRISRFHSNLVENFVTSQTIHRKCALTEVFWDRLVQRVTFARIMR